MVVSSSIETGIARDKQQFSVLEHYKGMEDG
jgi:hypothetical protein